MSAWDVIGWWSFGSCVIAFIKAAADDEVRPVELVLLFPVLAAVMVVSAARLAVKRIAGKFKRPPVKP